MVTTIEPTNNLGYFFCGVPTCQKYFQVIVDIDPPIEPTEDCPEPPTQILDQEATYEEYWADASAH